MTLPCWPSAAWCVLVPARKAESSTVGALLAAPSFPSCFFFFFFYAGAAKEAQIRKKGAASGAPTKHPFGSPEAGSRGLKTE